MIKVKISNFIKKNKYKIQDLLTKLIIVAIIIFIATILLSSFNIDNNSNEPISNIDVYNPTGTVIQGSTVSEEQYKTDSNIVEKFLEYCNKEQIQAAYDLLSDECKEEVYPTIEDFKRRYYNYIFEEKRECNIQSWISTKEYTVYRIRYTTDMLATGIYEQDNVYQDYITLLKDSNEEKLSIGNFIKIEELNGITTTTELEVQTLRKITYLEYEEYEILVKNKTENTILLDRLNSTENIKLINTSGKTDRAYTNEIFIQDIKIDPNTRKKITIRFDKACDSSEEGKYIHFSKVVRNYDIYIENQESYSDLFYIKINI